MVAPWMVIVGAAVVIVVLTLPAIALFLWRISAQLQVLIDLTAAAYVDDDENNPQP